MYEDLDDLLPKRQTSAALENPFEDAFSSDRTTSVDPWSVMGGSGAGGFGAVDDWSTNAFADHESPFRHPANYGEPAALETPKTEDMTTPTEEPPTPTAAVVTRDDHVHPSPVVESITPSVPIVAAVDPLDAAASNIEEEVHVPVIRRKLPLLSPEPVPPPPPEPTPAPNEPSPPKPAQVALEDPNLETETPPAEIFASPPAASPSEEAPQTSIITPATPPAAETTPPGRRAPSSPPSKTTTPSSHSSASAFSEQAQSSSRQSSNIIVSPLEAPSRASIAPLGHNYSGLPLGTDTGGWGGGFGGWGGGSSLPTAYGTEEVAATPSTETGSETPSEKRAGSTDEEDVRIRVSLLV